MSGSEGTQNNFYQGFYNLARIPMLPGDWQIVVLETEPINPLYTGQYAVGPYTANTVEPSGTSPAQPGECSRQLQLVVGRFLHGWWGERLRESCGWNGGCSCNGEFAGVVDGDVVRVWSFGVVFAEREGWALADGGGDGAG